MCSSNTLREKSEGEQLVPINSTYRCESKRDRIYQSGDLKWGSLDGVEGQRRYHTKVRTLPMQHLEGDPRREMVESFSLTYLSFCIPNRLREKCTQTVLTDTEIHQSNRVLEEK